MRLLAVACFLMVGCAALAPRTSFWAVRRVADGSSAYIEARSRIVRGAMDPASTLNSVLLVEEQSHGVRLSVRADNASEHALNRSIPAISSETKHALAWLQGTGILSWQHATLTLVLVDAGVELDITERNPSRNATVLKLYSPVDTSSAARLSSTIRGGFAALFHELAHVRPVKSKGRARRGEEYLATMFESCYLVASMRGDDRLHLKSILVHPAGYVLGSSSKGTGDAIALLRDIAGADVVDAKSRDSLRNLRTACRRFIDKEFSGDRASP